MLTADYTLTDWQAVPARVVKLLPQALQIKAAHLAAAADTELLDLCTASWEPTSGRVRLHPPAGLRQLRKAAFDAYCQRMPVSVDVSSAPVDPETAIQIKCAGIPLVAPTFDFAQRALGGPNPLTNSIVGGLMAGGLGYGAGALAENLFPERYIERGRLRKNLALMGLLGGAGFGAANAYANARGNMTGREFSKAPFKNFLRGYLMPNDAPLPRFVTPNTLNDTTPSPSILDDTAKVAAFGQPPLGAFGQPLQQPGISVPQFNNAVWRDTQRGLQSGFQMHTPPQYAAATTGLMAGISAQKQSPIISPRDVVNGIASAGVGLATANIAGRALSALAGLTPAGQEKLQDLGLFGGMMHSIVPAMFGRR